MEIGSYLIALAVAFFFFGSSAFSAILFGGIAYWITSLFSTDMATIAGIVVGIIIFIATPNK